MWDLSECGSNPGKEGHACFLLLCSVQHHHHNVAYNIRGVGDNNAARISASRFKHTDMTHHKKPCPAGDAKRRGHGG